MKNKRTDEKLKNFLPLNRKFFDHPFWNEKREYSKAEAWLDLIRMANFRDTQDCLQIGFKTVTWATGQVPISYRFLATRWKWSHCRIKTFLDYLIKEEMITLESVNGQTILSLTNYQKYNNSGTKVVPSNPRGSAIVDDGLKNRTPNSTQTGTPNRTLNGTLKAAPVEDLTIPSEHKIEHQPEQGASTSTGTLPEQDPNKSNTVLRTNNNIERGDAPTSTQYGSNRDPRIPTLDDVRLTFYQKGGTDEMAEKFYNNYEATGWYKNGSPIRNYTPLVDNFIKNYNQKESSKVGRPVSFALNKEDKNSYV